MRRASATGPIPLTPQDWVALAAATSESIVSKGLHMKPTAALQAATKSLRIDGFTFVGGSNLALGSSKGSKSLCIFFDISYCVLIRYVGSVRRQQKRPRSRRELSELLHRGQSRVFEIAENKWELKLHI